MRLTKITTKTGDSGKTLLNGEFVDKFDPSVDLIGDLDELNCLLGNIDNMQDIQDDIFEISAAIYKTEDWKDSESSTDALEQNAEFLNSKLKPLKEFIRPSGNIHLARAVCRRCERKAWALDRTKKYNIYLNRLSDYLFVVARINSDGETQWEHK